MAHQWRGVINEYREWLTLDPAAPIIELGEGGTPCIVSPELSDLTGAWVWLKFEGANPTGSFKDRGMTVAMSAAVHQGAKAVICASTGNTSASAAAYSARAKLPCVVLIPVGKIALGKLSQAMAHGAQILQVDGNFDDCLRVARELAETYQVELVNSVNPWRIEGQKTAAFEIVDALGKAPDIHILPVGNAGNITAYWAGYQEYAAHGRASHTPKMWGFQAEGAAPIVRGYAIPQPETIATAIRIGNPASWEKAEAARDQSQGLIEMVSDAEILAGHSLLAKQIGLFAEPASAAGVAGLLKLAKQGRVPEGATVAITVTGHGLKDTQWAMRDQDGREIQPQAVPADTAAIARVLELA